MKAMRTYENLRSKCRLYVISSCDHVEVDCKAMSLVWTSRFEEHTQGQDLSSFSRQRSKRNTLDSCVVLPGEM